jgi:hypothetical protein
MATLYCTYPGRYGMYDIKLYKEHGKLLSIVINSIKLYYAL